MTIEQLKKCYVYSTLAKEWSTPIAPKRSLLLLAQQALRVNDRKHYYSLPHDKAIIYEFFLDLNAAFINWSELMDTELTSLSVCEQDGEETTHKYFIFTEL